MSKVIITGSSGFIGYHVAKKLLEKKVKIIGIDNHNNYYAPRIKINRLKLLKKYKNFKFYKLDIKNKKKLSKILKKEKPKQIIHLAAQVGVRYSFIDPKKYVYSNIMGTNNILECMVEYKIKKLIFASSSSVYGNQKKMPIKENMETKPINFYGLTKLMNEKQIKLFFNNYKIDFILLRFFTAYGPFGRPDMFIPKLKKNLILNKKVDLYNHGNHKRDFTFVDDIANIIFLLFKKKKFNDKNRVLNICSGKKTDVRVLIKKIEKIMKKNAKFNNKGIQKGDMFETHGSNAKLKKYLRYNKFKDIDFGLKKTI